MLAVWVQDGGGLIGFYVAVEAGWTSSSPVALVVLRSSGAMAQSAEERVVPGIDYYADVPGPDHQIARLRVLHSAEVVGAAIKIRGVRVGIGESGSVIDGVDQVRAVDPRSTPQVAVEGGVND
jgi:hypothetical protein